MKIGMVNPSRPVRRARPDRARPAPSFPGRKKKTGLPPGANRTLTNSKRRSLLLRGLRRRRLLGSGLRLRLRLLIPQAVHPREQPGEHLLGVLPLGDSPRDVLVLEP